MFAVVLILVGASAALAMADTAAPAQREGSSPVRFTPHTRRLSHTHGGAPAHLDFVTLDVQNPTAATARVTLVGGDLVRGDVVEPLVVQGIAPDQPETVPRAPSLSLALAARARLDNVRVLFQSVEVTSSHIAPVVRLRLRVDAARVTVDVPLQVIRREPLRPHEP